MELIVVNIEALEEEIRWERWLMQLSSVTSRIYTRISTSNCSGGVGGHVRQRRTGGGVGRCE